MVTLKYIHVEDRIRQPVHVQSGFVYHAHQHGQPDIRNLAFEHAAQKGAKGFTLAKKPAGYYGFKCFMQRHPYLAVKKAENLSIARTMAQNRQHVDNWYDKYQETLTHLGHYRCSSSSVERR